MWKKYIQFKLHFVARLFINKLCRKNVALPIANVNWKTKRTTNKLDWYLYLVGAVKKKYVRIVICKYSGCYCCKNTFLATCYAILRHHEPILFYIFLFLIWIKSQGSFLEEKLLHFIFIEFYDFRQQNPFTKMNRQHIHSIIVIDIVEHQLWSTFQCNFSWHEYTAVYYNLSVFSGTYVYCIVARMYAYMCEIIHVTWDYLKTATATTITKLEYSCKLHLVITHSNWIATSILIERTHTHTRARGHTHTHRRVQRAIVNFIMIILITKEFNSYP